MNDVKEICERVLTTPGLTMPSADDLLVTARGVRRRRRIRTAMATSAVAAAAAAVVVALPALGPLGADRPAPGATVQVTSRVPEGEAELSERLAELAEALNAALPPGYRTRWPADQTSRRGGDNRLTMYGTVIDVVSGDRGGQLGVYLIREPAPGGNLCAAPVDDGLIGMGFDTCQVIDVDGVPVRYGVAKVSRPGAKWDPPVDGGTVEDRYAIRYIDGWSVIVAQRLYVRDTSDGTTAFNRHIFTVDQLARLATNPALQP